MRTVESRFVRVETHDDDLRGMAGKIFAPERDAVVFVAHAMHTLFEVEFANWCSAPHCVAVSLGGDQLVDVRNRVLDAQVGERKRLSEGARATWRGRYGDDFEARVALCIDDAARLAIALRKAAQDVDELARFAGVERDRRAYAHAWLQSHHFDDWHLPEQHVEHTVNDVRHWAYSKLNQPPPNPPVDPPKIAIIFLGTFFQQVLVIGNTVRKVDPALLEAAQTLGASGWRLVSRVVIPASTSTDANMVCC